MLLGGCAFLPYQYNENLTAEENAYYANEHAKNAQRAGAAMREWSYNQQSLEIQRQRGGGTTTRCTNHDLTGGNPAIVCNTY